MIVVNFFNFWHYIIFFLVPLPGCFYRYVMLTLIVPVSWISVSVFFCSGSLDGTLTTLEGGIDMTQLPGCMF